MSQGRCTVLTLFSIRQKVRFFKVCMALVGISASLSGCTDDEIIDPFIVVSQSQESQTTLANSEAELTSTISSTPEPTPPVDTSTNSVQSVNQDAQFEETGDSSETFNSINGNEILALQRLSPATEFTLIVTNDGSTFRDLINFEDGLIENEGVDTTLAVSLPDGSVKACNFKNSEYFCVRLFDDSSGLISVFSLASDNRGEGIFHVCAAIADNITQCVNGLFSAPAGTMTVSAGLQSAFVPVAQGLMADDGAYLRYVAESKTTPALRSEAYSAAWVAKLQTLINLSTEHIIQ